MTELALQTFYDDLHYRYGYGAWRPRKYYYDLLKYVDNPTSGCILDIGIGSGYFLDVAIRTGLESYGIDISEIACILTRRITPKAKAKVQRHEMSTLPYDDNFFDYITAFGSIEHSLDIESTLKEIRRVAKPGVKICLMVPNKDFFLHWLGWRAGDQEELQLSLAEWKELFSRHFKINRISRDKWHWINKIPVPLRFTYVFMFELEAL